MAAPDVNICGFETGDLYECDSSTGTVSVQGSVVRTGSYALRTNPTGTNTGRASLAGRDAAGQQAAFSVATCYYRFYFRFGTKASSGHEYIFAAANSANDVKLGIMLDSNGKLLAYDKFATNLLGTGSTVLAANTWYRIEAKVGTGASTTWEILLATGDGSASVELSGSGADLSTFNNGRAFLGKVINRGGNSVDYYFDDVAISSSGYPGAGASYLIQPTNDGTYTTWTIGAGSGSKYQQIDEVPYDSDTTYLISTNTLNDASTSAFDVTAVVPANSTVNAIKMVPVCKRDVANSTIRLRFRSGSTNSDTGSDVTIGSTYELIKLDRIFATDPNTSAAWALANTSALEAGCIERSTSNKTRLTACYLMADVLAPHQGPAGAWTPTNATRTKLFDGTFRIGLDSFKLALFQSTSNIGAGSTTYAGVTNEVANGNGYTTGGKSVRLAVQDIDTHVMVYGLDSPFWSASGGDIVAYYAAIYEVGGDVAFFAQLDLTPQNWTIFDGEWGVVKVAADTGGVANIFFATG